MTMTQMDRHQASLPILPDLPGGWLSFVDSASGQTIFLNAATKDIAYNLTDCFKQAATAELAGKTNRIEKSVEICCPTPGVPVVASVPLLTAPDNDSDTIVASIYNGSVAGKPTKKRRVAKRKKGASTVSLATHSIPGTIFVSPDVDKKGNTGGLQYTTQQTLAVARGADSIATAALPSTEDFLQFKLPSSSETESESGSQSGSGSESDSNGSTVQSENLLDGL